MRVVERTTERLVLESKPRLAFGVLIVLGLSALLASLYALAISGEPADKDNLFGLVMGLVCVVGALLLYRETTTVLDRRTAKLSWRQSGLTGERTDVAGLDQVRDVVIGRPVSDQSGGASRVCLVLDDRILPLMFGFTGTARHNKVRAMVREFLDLS